MLPDLTMNEFMIGVLKQEQAPCFVMGRMRLKVKTAVLACSSCRSNP